MKIGIFQDVHANLPAFKKAIEVFRSENCTKIIHVGDLVGIGPYPKETLELALSIKEMDFVMGNHDYWCSIGLPDPIPDWMGTEEVSHELWTQSQIGEKLAEEIKKWKFSIDLKLAPKWTITFQHYALTEDRNWFQTINKNPEAHELDKMFDYVDSDYIFYGHNHSPHDEKGKCRYVNLGSAGCHDKPEIRLAILESKKDNITLKKRTIAYNDNGLMEEFDKKKVPAREFIKKIFIIRN
jgi:putative phosphoesterase